MAQGQPILAVCLITYNHRKYIEQAIEGVLMQRTKFAFKLVIADDCSTDGTREILLEYKNKYPDFIDLILQDINVGALKNWLDLIKYPRVKYIAYFEGDDYWTDPCKLQKQVDYLQANENVSMVSNIAQIYNQQKCEYTGLAGGKLRRGRIDAKEIILGGGGLIPTCSVVCKAEIFREIPNWFFAMSVGDYGIFLLMLANGEVHHLDFIGGVYRFDLAGVSWSSEFMDPKATEKRVKLHKGIINGLTGYNNYTDFKYTKIIESAIEKRIVQILLERPHHLINKQELNALHDQLCFRNKLSLFFLNYFSGLISVYLACRSVFSKFYRKYFSG